MDENKKDERVAKIIARAGLCSRREAERLILRGLVRVDGELITSPALNISAKAKIDVDGNPLPDPQPTRMLRYHKPAGR